MASITERLFEPGHLEEDYPITVFYWKQTILTVFLQTNQKHKFQACFLRRQVFSNELNLEFYWAFCKKKKNLRIFLLFQKALWLGNFHLIAPVRVATL